MRLLRRRPRVLCLPITGRYIPVMRSEAPALMPIFRSQHQAALLAWLLFHPDHEYTLTELAKRLHVPLTTLQREAQRLVVAGLLQDLSLIHISEPTRLGMISYAVF